MNFFQRKKTNYGKIVAISIAAAAVASAVAYVVYRLIKKYTEELVCDCDDLLDGECCDCCEFEIEEAGDAEAEAEEVAADAE